MPPNEECPICRQLVEDWHVEWYKAERSALHKGHVAMDCPLCAQAIGFQHGVIGPAPLGVPLMRRHVDKAAEWAVLGADYAGGTLYGYLSTSGAGSQYADYWSAKDVAQADLDEIAKQQRP